MAFGRYVIYSETADRADASIYTQEGQVSTIDLKEDQTLPIPMDDPLLINHMLQYIYGLDYLEELEPEQKLLGKPRKKDILRAEEDFLDGEEWTMSIGHEGEYSAEIAPGGNAYIHAQMCAIADFYGVPDLLKVAQHKFKVALAGLRDVRGLLHISGLVCNPEFQGDAELRGMMADKIIRHNKLLDNPKIEAVLLEDAELTLVIAKRMRSKQ
jgi:hypothetical protein